MAAERAETRQARYVVGLMSGTSVDGIDAAVVRIAGGAAAGFGTGGEGAAASGNRAGSGGRSGDGQGSGVPAAELVAFANTPFPARVREEIFALFDPARATVDRVGRMNVRLGELYAEAALAVIADAGLTPADIAVVGSHGQTIYHAPEPYIEDGRDLRFTVQIGEGAVIAARTGIPCVSDFRVADMAVGGQGAPLVPFTEYLLYREPDRTLLLQNIGGIGNMTVLPAGGGADDVFAFDTGPGNMLIDGVVTRLSGGARTMDAGGEIARAGRVDGALLERLRREPYYARPLPKSTGRERFGAAYVEELLADARGRGMADADLVATVTMLTAWSIGDAYRRFVLPKRVADVMLVGGGGSYNPALIGFLKEELAPHGVRVLVQEDVGGSSDAKEAVAFALLADYAIARRTNNLPSVTGAARPVVMGKISY
ncbi:anhydro-N-acetylmuramic acid kinase [Paenibacillus sp. MWE-103]|uniref:Anhydro-N-acetylmuramic acid kinase n=1 Tax=Paenibacillus artemisiicola TaxID=1172618 RepID=A0ABS3W8N1_9BACL|nr:anhydro-N-acetylmuramic acid kinase [Paenibacillus artemisiicola]MBO7744642.1 anhydro-N-acetylmuramic acid kinase [Paenibacillus artemisiicola]